MSKAGGRFIVALATAGVLFWSCSPSLGPGKGGNGAVSDANPPKVFPSLAAVLAKVGDKERVPVLIMLRNETDMQELERMAEELQVTRRYKVVPAMAAAVTKQQVDELALLPWVRHIEHDAKVTRMMDAASYWFGARAARADYGVSGSLDGEPRYSRDDVVIAIIDTGIDPDHADLGGGKVIAWKDFVSNRTEPYDDHGHGTHVAGIAAGSGQGNPSYTGVAPGAALVGVKVLDRFGSGSLSNVTAAVDWVVEHRAEHNIRVMSMNHFQLIQMVG